MYRLVIFLERSEIKLNAATATKFIHEYLSTTSSVLAVPRIFIAVLLDVIFFLFSDTYFFQTQAQDQTLC